LAIVERQGGIRGQIMACIHDPVKFD